MFDSDRSDIDFEIIFYEGVLRHQPDFLQALIALGELYTKKGHYEKGLAIDLTLQSLRPDDPVVLYNLACSYSLLNQIDLALLTIKKAIALGYDEFEFMRTDDDLANLQKDSRFQSYLAQFEKNGISQKHI